MFGALLLFEDEFIHVVAISYTALILTELTMVALTIRTWHPLMVLAELLSILLYLLSLILLREFFGEVICMSLFFFVPQKKNNVQYLASFQTQNSSNPWTLCGRLQSSQGCLACLFTSSSSSGGASLLPLIKNCSDSKAPRSSLKWVFTDCAASHQKLQ